MFTKFKSVDDLLEGLKDTKFSHVAVSAEWLKFDKVCKIENNVLTIKDKEFPIVYAPKERNIIFIAVPGN